MQKSILIISIFLFPNSFWNGGNTWIITSLKNNAMPTLRRSEGIRMNSQYDNRFFTTTKSKQGFLDSKNMRTYIKGRSSALSNRFSNTLSVGNNDDNLENNNMSLSPPNTKKKSLRKRKLPQIAVKIYVDYLQRLWGETSPDERRHIAQDKARDAVKTVQHLMLGEEYTARELLSKEDKQAVKAREHMLEACRLLLASMDKTSVVSDENEKTIIEVERNKDLAVQSPTYLESLSRVKQEGGERSESIITTNNTKNIAKPKKKKKSQRSILFGATMGAVVACWVFSGNYIFTGLFTLMTILGQLEYYRMVMNAGIYSARRISVVGACSMFITALFAPDLHQLCLPFMTLAAMMWFLMMRQQVTNISEIATTVTGMLYLGYIPSFWVRLRLLGAARGETRLAPLVEPLLNFLGTKASNLPAFIPKSIHLPITTGAIFIFWTWLCIAFSDVGAYFAGRRFGKTKLATLSPAAGATSPNKTVEGLIGGCVVSGLLGLLGAWIQKWPWWYVTGAVHGVLLALLGLIGDLTASMLKRDAGLKDFGDLIPEHGGIMDRVDSFIFTAPYSYFICSLVIPQLKRWSGL